MVVPIRLLMSNSDPDGNAGVTNAFASSAGVTGVPNAT